MKKIFNKAKCLVNKVKRVHVNRLDSALVDNSIEGHNPRDTLYSLQIGSELILSCTDEDFGCRVAIWFFKPNQSNLASLKLFARNKIVLHLDLLNV